MVADAISGYYWSLLHLRSQQEVDLHAYLTTLKIPLPINVEDKHEWIDGDSSLRFFRTFTTWKC